MLNPDEIHERLRLAGEEWADADAAANALEETKNTLLAELMNIPEAASEGERKRRAQSSREYRAHLESMVEARRQANRAKVRYETARIWCELVRTAESTKRAEILQR